MDESWEEVTQLAAKLIACESVCPADDGAQKVINDYLREAGFSVEPLTIGGINSLLAIYGGSGPLLAFSGHSDVVPAGDPAKWTHPPFEPIVEEGNLYGRGAIDMKGPMAASLVAAKRFLANSRSEAIRFRLGFLIAGDEEVMSNHGTTDLLATLAQRGDRIEHCIVTESTSHAALGDMAKIGRRGSLVGQITIKGLQGHSAYPHLARNPISGCLKPLHELAEREWGEGHPEFPKTTFQITNINAGTGVANVIPGELKAIVNFRYSPDQTEKRLIEQVESTLEQAGLEFIAEWAGDAQPFITGKGLLSETLAQAIKLETGIDTEFSTSGGTSDARFIAPTGAEVIEFGTLSRLCHQVDEHVSVDDLEKLARIYERVLEGFQTHYQQLGSA